MNALRATYTIEQPAPRHVIVERMHARADSKGEELVDGPYVVDRNGVRCGRALTLAKVTGAVELTEYLWDDIRQVWSPGVPIRLTPDMIQAIWDCWHTQPDDESSDDDPCIDDSES